MAKLTALMEVLFMSKAAWLGEAAKASLMFRLSWELVSKVHNYGALWGF